MAVRQQPLFETERPEDVEARLARTGTDDLLNDNGRAKHEMISSFEHIEDASDRQYEKTRPSFLNRVRVLLFGS